MPKIYVQNDGDEQPVEFTGDLTELVADETFYQDPRYKAIVAESIERRKKIKELSSTLQVATTPDPATVTPVAQETPAPPVTTPEPVNIDELYEQFKQRQAQETAAAKAEREALVALLQPNGLDESFLPILQAAKDPALMAQELGRKKLTFAQTGVNTSAQVPDDFAARVNKRLGLK